MADMSPIFNDGYVRYIDHMGTDLTIVNTARASFEKESLEMTDKDANLLSFIVKNKHDSCLRHCAMTFELRLPLMVTRQMEKHIVASAHLEDQNGHNEASRRYVTSEPSFYRPEHFLSTPANKKQGAGAPVDDATNNAWLDELAKFQDMGAKLYAAAIDAGIAAEQARLFLPAYGLYISWRWTASLNALLHFLDLRTDNAAQSEIRQVASKIAGYVEKEYPLAYKAWNER